MKKSLWAVLILSFIFAGCSATTAPSTSTQVQIRMAQLEKDLRDRDGQIEKLNSAVQELTYQVEDLESSVSSSARTSVRSEVSRAVSVSSKSEDVSGSDGDIIRVSASIQDVQTALKNAGYYSYNVDGKLGDMTKQAIKDFQKDNGLKSDGIIGKQTWAELKSYLQ